MTKYRILVLLLLVLAFSHCKKDDVKRVRVSGKVINLCTDSATAGVKVYLNDLETVSGQDGLFAFEDVEIHSSDKYKYVVSTESNSGIGMGQVIFDGISVTLDKGDPGKFMTLGVSPGVLTICYKINNTDTIRAPDSIAVYFEQKTFHSNFPGSVYDFPSVGGVHGPVLQTNIAPWPSNPCTFCPTANCVGTIWMGQWSITVIKVKSGVRSTFHDSIYVPWKGSATYNVQW